MGSFFKKKCICLLTITMIEVNAVWAMPTYEDWKIETQKILPVLWRDKFLCPDTVTKQCYVWHVKMWAEVSKKHYRGSWKKTLPTMHALCTLGYFLVQANLLGRGNAMASVEYALDLLDSEATPDLQAEWKPKFEEIQQVLLAIE
ncbi:MAG: hypothetical protein LBB19_04055 [Puniceicoccales bacterium]|jgi:hypothetical protein|nr:hypothetical protein [Puniceicoccales bacterium]